jgi:hypothetical protein
MNATYADRSTDTHCSEYDPAKIAHVVRAVLTARDALAATLADLYDDADDSGSSQAWTTALSALEIAAENTLIDLTRLADPAYDEDAPPTVRGVVVDGRLLLSIPCCPQDYLHEGSEYSHGWMILETAADALTTL